MYIFDFAFPLVTITSQGQIHVDLYAQCQLSYRKLLAIRFLKYYTLFFTYGTLSGPKSFAFILL